MRIAQCRAVCDEMNRILGKNVFVDTRSCESDDEGFWRYYVTARVESGLTLSQERELEEKAMKNLGFI